MIKCCAAMGGAHRREQGGQTVQQQTKNAPFPKRCDAIRSGAIPLGNFCGVSERKRKKKTTKKKVLSSFMPVFVLAAKGVQQSMVGDYPCMHVWM